MCFVGECGRGAWGETVWWCVLQARGWARGCWVLVNKGWVSQLPQTLEGIGPSRTVVLVLMMLERDLRFSRAPTSLPGGLHTVEYRGTSLIRQRPPLGPYSRAMPRAPWYS